MAQSSRAQPLSRWRWAHWPTRPPPFLWHLDALASRCRSGPRQPLLLCCLPLAGPRCPCLSLARAAAPWLCLALTPRPWRPSLFPAPAVPPALWTVSQLSWHSRFGSPRAVLTCTLSRQPASLLLSGCAAVDLCRHANTSTSSVLLRRTLRLDWPSASLSLRL